MDGFNEQEYIRNQNLLSDFEDITLGSSPSNATEMLYDGFVCVAIRGDNGTVQLFADNVIINSAFQNGWGGGAIAPVRKGQKIYSSIGTGSGTYSYKKGAFYKNRDYSNR